MRTLKLTLAYDGTEYVGWQRQAAGASIQGCLEAALRDIEGAPVSVVGAGRTDAGVHALGQVAGVRLGAGIDPEALARAVNARLPADIRVVESAAAADTFHARFDAAAKSYRYRLAHGPVMSPFIRRYAWHVRDRLDVEAMNEAGRTLVGEHDFAAFQAAGSSVRTTVRTVFGLTVRPAAPASAGAEAGGADMTVIEVRGSGFLRHMVRTIVGTLVDVGRGRRGPEEVARALRAADRGAAGPTAPPRGLFLLGVEYPGDDARGRRPPPDPARPGRHSGARGEHAARVGRPCVPAGFFHPAVAWPARRRLRLHWAPNHPAASMRRSTAQTPGPA